MTVSTASATAAKAAPLDAGAARNAIDRVGVPGWIQAMPFGLVFLFFFVIPLILVVIVSFWDYNDYEMLPSFTTRSYTENFEGCLASCRISARSWRPTHRRRNSASSSG